MLGINLNSLLPWRGAERIARIVRRLAHVGNVCGDVHQSGDLWVVSYFADHSASPGMTNEDDWTILQGDHPTSCIDVVRQRRQRVLHGDNMKPTRFKDWNDLRPARAVCKSAVHEHDVLHA